MFFKKATRSMYVEDANYRTQMVHYRFVTSSAAELNEIPEASELDLNFGEQWIESVIENAIDVIHRKDDLSPSDRVSISMYGESLLRAVYRIQQSKREWTYGVNLDMDVTIVKDLKAHGRTIKTNIMSEELWRDRREKGIILYSTKTSSPQDDIRHWLNWAEYAYNLSPRSSFSPETAQATWQEELTQWRFIEEVNVIVLEQTEEDKTHQVIWKSRCNHSTTVLVLWLKTDEARIAKIAFPHQLYRDTKQKICFKCGVTFGRVHHCGASSTPYRGKHRPHFRCTEKQLAAKRSRLDNDESRNCLGRALYAALNETKKELCLTQSLKGWYEELEVEDLWDEPAGLEDVRMWSQIINAHYGKQLEIVVYDQTLRKVLARFGGESVKCEEREPLFLNLNHKHFTWIRSMPSWIGTNYFCSICMKGYSHKDRHQCTRPCHYCGDWKEVHNRPRFATVPIVCKDCHCSFWTPTCFRNHNSIVRFRDTFGYTQCMRRYTCPDCGLIVDRLENKPKPHLTDKSKHICFQYKCHVCSEDKAIRGSHQCYIKGKKEEKGDKKENKSRTMRLAFFDFETRCLDGDHHTVNKVVVLLTCEECVDHLEEYATRGCIGRCGHKRLLIFQTAREFMDWILREHHARWQDYTFIAHNLKGYDAYPILEECVRRGLTPSCIYQGSKVMTMNVEGVVFKDSVNFIPMALRKFPATFGTSGGKKGFFPHFFNTEANANYVGPYPSLDYYGYDEMTDEEERRELKQWWEEQQGKTMIFDQELTDYCIQDVLVMARGCLKFRELYVTMFDVAPFTECVTLPSTVLKVFQKNHLSPKILGVVPPLGYRPRDVYSTEAQEWIYSLQGSIQSALSPEGEKVLLCAKVDGYEERTRTVYQYHGCFFHGCEECYPQRHVTNPYLGITMNEAFIKTMMQTKNLRQAGYRVVEMWSHQWDVEREQHPEPPRSVTRHYPLQPRQALCGGRTNAIELYAWCRGEDIDPEDEADTVLKMLTEPVHRIRYIDVVSLYPTVMKEEEYPIGHPTIMTVNDLPPLDECVDNIRTGTWFGIAKVDIDAPRGLYFPVLPVIAQSRLIFGLCRTCCHEEDPPLACTHTQEERRWIDGVWTTFELKEALKQGYEIVNVHEVWHYEQRSLTLFSEYIRDNLKIKMEASGWPARCTTDEEKQAYLNEVKQREDITLEWDKVKVNPGLRTVAKLNLNSLWGKFGQNPFKNKVEYVNTPERFNELMYSDTVTVTNVVLLGNGVVQMSYTPHKESVIPLPYENVVLAACVTAHARLRLYRMLSRLDRRVLYHDTDSVIYKTVNEGDDEIPTGSCLGQWEDECKDPAKDWLVEFVSLGPKSYAYRTHKGNTVVKCKGITFTPSASDKLHIKSMKRLLMNGDGNKGEKVKITYPRKIVRDSLAKQLKTVSLTKKVQLVYTKRQTLDKIHTLPFGY